MFDAKTIYIRTSKKKQKEKVCSFFKKESNVKMTILGRKEKNAEKNLRIIFLTELIGSNKTIWHVPLLVRLCVLANDQ